MRRRDFIGGSEAQSLGRWRHGRSKGKECGASGPSRMAATRTPASAPHRSEDFCAIIWSSSAGAKVAICG
jgi:hypothetical protein